ncbi:HU family DNA-binding protein [Rhizobium sp. LjRoot258]|uniref:HU family DNA-binding protein n=1 Tax=Rhizobium sp. LjRoot258 TaxID=3342299 RepID=UPI003ECD8A2C
MTTANEIADKIATEHSLTKAQSKAIVAAVFAAITTAATSGTESSIPGFGKFKVKDTPEREARNPGTGAVIKIAAARKLAFTPAKALKDALNK